MSQAERELQTQLARVNKAPPPGIPRDFRTFDSKYSAHPVPAPWRSVCAAMDGQGLEGEDLDAFETVAGHRSPSTSGYSEVVAIAGRRAGKSEKGASRGVYVGIVEGDEHMRFLPSGTVGYFAVVSRTMRQSVQNFQSARAMVERHAELRAHLDGDPLESLTGGTMKFKSGVAFTCMPMSKASIRGYTIVGAVVDEVGWWATSDESPEADDEVISALRFGMLRPTGAPPRRLLVMSSPGPKEGYLWDAYQHWGKSREGLLVVHGSSTVWNPSLDRAQLDAERARDPRRATREIDAQFVDAVNPWIDSALIDIAAAGRSDKPIPRKWDIIRYVAGVDMAFKRDAAVLAIGHIERWMGSTDVREARRFVVDLVDRVAPASGAPLDAPAVVERFASTCKSYGVKTILGDQFGAVPLAGEFHRHGVRLDELTATSRSKFEVYGKLREALYARRVSLPQHEVALREFRQLEERVTGAGNVQIGAPNRSGAHDDCVSAIAWCFAAAEKHGVTSSFGQYEPLHSRRI
jgi:hypothetical protein